MINAMISPWNKWRQSNQKYATLLELLSHPLESYNQKNTNNARKWDVIRGKNGQLRLDLLVLIYLKPKTITSHVSLKRKLLITSHDPTDTLCRPTQIDG
jgi:site-specific recombinase